MRKHASSWIIKLLLGAIIVTFVLFFGYSSFRKGSRGGRVGAEGETALKVNGIPVSQAEYRYFLDRSYEQVKNSFKGQQMPDFAQQFASQMTTEQLINREVALTQADELGIVISDEELGNRIKNEIKAAYGEFDPIQYKHNIRRSFEARFGFNFEEFMRQNLRVDSLGSLFAKVDTKLANDPPGSEAAWTFERVVFSGDDAKTKAEEFIKSNAKDWKKALASLKLEPKKIGPITVSERQTIFDAGASADDYIKIFSLTKENPTTKEPVVIADKVYVARLVEKSEKPKKEAAPADDKEFFFSWMTALRNKADVKDYVTKK